jgi:hypothetical protein
VNTTSGLSYVGGGGKGQSCLFPVTGNKFLPLHMRQFLVVGSGERTAWAPYTTFSCTSKRHCQTKHEIPSPLPFPYDMHQLTSYPEAAIHCFFYIQGHYLCPWIWAANRHETLQNLGIFAQKIPYEHCVSSILRNKMPAS